MADLHRFRSSQDLNIATGCGTSTSIALQMSLIHTSTPPVSSSAWPSLVFKTTSCPTQRHTINDHLSRTPLIPPQLLLHSRAESVYPVRFLPTTQSQAFFNVTVSFPRKPSSNLPSFTTAITELNFLQIQIQCRHSVT